MSWAHGHWQKGIPFTYCRVMGTTFYKQISVLLKTPGMKGKDHNAAFCSSGHPFSDTFLESDSIWCSLPLTKLSHSLQGSHSSDHIPITLVTLAFCCCCCYFCPSSQNVNSLQQPTMIYSITSSPDPQVMCQTVEFQLALKAQNLTSGTIKVKKIVLKHLSELSQSSLNFRSVIMLKIKSMLKLW